MKSSARKVELASASDLFSTEQERQDAKLERVQQISLAELYPFPDHPFSVRDDDSMKETVESIKESGVLQPAIARPREGGGYELVSGHRRKRACELAGLDTMPVIVRDLDRDTAIIFMVDSNIQRENISPMELVETIASEPATPSVSQAQRMKQLSQSGKLNEDTMLDIMTEEKKPEVDKIVFTSDTLRKYFPRSYTPKQMQDTIIKLLDQWLKKRQRQQER